MLIKVEKRYYLFFENWMVLIHFKLNPHHLRMLCTMFCSWENDFNVCQYIFAIFLLSPLGEGHGTSFEQTWFPFTQGCFVPSLVEIGHVAL